MTTNERGTYYAARDQNKRQALHFVREQLIAKLHNLLLTAKQKASINGKIQRINARLERM